VEQVEFADVLVVSKVDLVSAEELGRLKAMLAVLNPGARVLEAERGRVALDAVLGTGLYDPERAAAAPGWMRELRGERTPESEEYGIRSFVYRARRPFHPRRLMAVLEDEALWARVLRSKGFFWLASRMEACGLWSQAGSSASADGAGTWYAAAPRAEWPDDPETLRSIEENWQEPWGDRRQELVFIGDRLDEAGLRARLDAALLDEREYARGPRAWGRYADPFPEWRAPGDDGQEG
jgi:G3E family GTPase